MLSKDLREWLEKFESKGEVKRVTKEIDWNMELSHLAKLNEEKGGPALLFENIKDYPGARVLSSVWGTTKRFAAEMGEPEDTSMMNLSLKWGELSNKEGIPPKEVSTGPIMENIIEGDEVDILKFPVPKFYEFDGGRFIGTSYCLVTADPDTGWINCGTYRLQVLDKNHTGTQLIPGKHAQQMLKRYGDQGKRMPALAVIGGPPILFPLGGGDIPFGTSEFDRAGALLGEPLEVVKSDLTGLPIPARAEIVLEGYIDYDAATYRMEGPFGEATGYYSGQPEPKPVFEVTRIYHRNDPIFQITTVGRPTTDTHIVGTISRGGALWQQLLATKIPGIKAVHIPPEMGNRGVIISLKQMYVGHSKQVLHAAASTPYGSYANKIFLVVDDDISPDDWPRVVWAWSQRFDAVRSIEILQGRRSTWLEPGIEPKKRFPIPIISTLLIDGCIPYEWEEKPKIIELDKAIVASLEARWNEFLG